MIRRLDLVFRNKVIFLNNILNDFAKKNKDYCCQDLRMQGEKMNKYYAVVLEVSFFVSDPAYLNNENLKTVEFLLI